MERYNFTTVEKKWRERWAQTPVNAPEKTEVVQFSAGESAQNRSRKAAFYCLDMFPYPSGKGLHVGHWRGYTLSDAISRYHILKGEYVLHTMGWDAFGLPAENYAIKNNVHPSKAVTQCVETFKRQLCEIDAVYDWSREINTTDPEYYKWTQWIFVQMFKKGLAYEKEMPLNWCPSCKIVLANEEAAGGTCERCKGPVTKKPLRQWMLKITEYADRLLAGLDELEWPEKVKRMQSEWIGKSYGAEIDFAVENTDKRIKVYTTRPDTLFGATFMVLAPEHDIVSEITTPDRADDVARYAKEAAARSNVDRMAAKDKTGAFTGAYCVNPLTGAKMPVWISDYVLADYGTGAIMCVPAHDDRDFEFAKKFELPIVRVITENGEKRELKEAFTGEGVMVNSGPFDGLTSAEAKTVIADFVEEKGIGKKTVNFKLRDWVFSRQRYWGEPIPLVHCEKCGVVPVPEEQLPVRLPDVASYKPTDTGESPLAKIDEWVNTTCPCCGGAAKRETNTMPQWAGSSWYFLRYADPNNADELASKEALSRFLPVNFYVGGIEHAVLHLLYARFYTKFLYDIGAVPFEEPFKRLFSIGMICNKGHKMDKSGDNAVSPDEVVARYGCDALRMYEMFIAPPELDADWEDSGLAGVARFTEKLWRFVNENKGRFQKPNANLTRLRHKMVRDITTRVENLTMNTAISGLMEYTNKFTDEAKSSGGIDRESVEALAIMTAPFGPHLAEELWEMAGNDKSVFEARWPSFDPELAKDDEITLAIQINGKLRGTITIPADADDAAAKAAAKEAVAEKLANVELVKEIFVKGKLVNFVVKGA